MSSLIDADEAFEKCQLPKTLSKWVTEKRLFSKGQVPQTTYLRSLCPRSSTLQAWCWFLLSLFTELLPWLVILCPWICHLRWDSCALFSMTTSELETSQTLRTNSSLCFQSNWARVWLNLENTTQIATGQRECRKWSRRLIYLIY